MVRPTTPDDFQNIRALCRRVYPHDEPWEMKHLESHFDMFPEGQLVAVNESTHDIVGMAASLIVAWDDYDWQDTYLDFTDNYMFTNHDPQGRTLYGAEVMVAPESQGQGVGKSLYKARREICHTLKLRRIRAGARLSGYHHYAKEMPPLEYTLRVINGELTDPTLTFQIKQGFRVFNLVQGYFEHDPQSLGHAALIEWINHRVASKKDYQKRDPMFALPKPAKSDKPGSSAAKDQK